MNINLSNVELDDFNKLLSRKGLRNKFISDDTIKSLYNLLIIYKNLKDYYLKNKDNIKSTQDENKILVNNLERVGEERFKQQKEIERLKDIIQERDEQIKKSQQELSSAKYVLDSIEQKHEDQMNTFKSQVRNSILALEELTRETYETFDD